MIEIRRVNPLGIAEMFTLQYRYAIIHPLTPLAQLEDPWCEWKNVADVSVTMDEYSEIISGKVGEDLKQEEKT